MNLNDEKELQQTIRKILVDVELLKAKEEERSKQQGRIDSYRTTIIAAIVIWIMQNGLMFFADVLPKLKELLK